MTAGLSRRGLVLAVAAALLAAGGAGLGLWLSSDHGGAGHGAARAPGLPSPSATEQPSAVPSSTPPTALPGTSTRHPSGASRPTPQATREAFPPFDLHASMSARADPHSSADYPTTILELHVTGHVRDHISYAYLQFEAVNPYNGVQFGTPCAVYDPTTVDVHPIDKTYTFRYRYRAAGPHRTSVWLLDACAGDIDERIQLPLQFDVPKGSTHSNGPENPTIESAGPSVQANRVTLPVRGLDVDGFIRTIAFDWGDGGAPTVVTFPNSRDQRGCEDRDGSEWPGDDAGTTQSSPPLLPGTYHVTVTVTSTGCDFSDEQSATKSWSVTVR